MNHAVPSLLVALALLPACHRAHDPTASPGAEGAPVGYPGTLRSPDELGPDVQWQQRVTAHWEGDAQSFEAVLSKADDELLLVGLSPMKTPGFVVRLHDGEVELDNRSPQEVPFDPRYIMLDVQRVYFPWIPGEPPADGERSHHTGGELVTERWAGGHLQERRFRREGGTNEDLGSERGARRREGGRRGGPARVAGRGRRSDR